jgi:hypothetical protein
VLRTFIRRGSDDDIGLVRDDKLVLLVGTMKLVFFGDRTLVLLVANAVAVADDVLVLVVVAASSLDAKNVVMIPDSKP